MGTFSKRIRQRVGIAQALLNYPAVFFLDEPASSLGPEGQREIGDLIVRRHGDEIQVQSQPEFGTIFTVRLSAGES